MASEQEIKATNSIATTSLILGIVGLLGVAVPILRVSVLVKVVAWAALGFGSASLLCCLLGRGSNRVVALIGTVLGGVEVWFIWYAESAMADW